MFGIIGRRFQLKFKDRAAAGSILAEILGELLKKENLQRSIIVLGIPRGGIVTADAVARNLSTAAFKSVDFDVILPRKLRDKDNKEQAIGAIMEDGTTHLDYGLIKLLQITSEYLEKEKAEQIKEIRRRKTLYSIYKPISQFGHLKDKTVILTDDGASTGSTLIAAARWLRTNRDPNRLFIAVPAAPKSTVKLLKRECDSVVVISESSTFRSVEQFYHDFKQVPDNRVVEILRTRKLLV